MKAWKVALRSDDQWVSCISLEPVVYDLNIPTARPVNSGPLAAFRTRAAARLFRKYSTPTYSNAKDDLRIFRCTVTESTDIGLWHRGLADLRIMGVPAGTIFCDSITIH